MNNKLNKLLEEYSKETLIDLYITQNKSQKELSKILGVGLSTTVTLLHKYDIKKDHGTVASLRQSTSMKRYGVSNPAKSQEIRDKIKEANIKKFGKASYMATEDGIKRSKIAKLNKYGNPNYNNSEKAQQTKLEHYNAPFYNNRAKYKQTCLTNYGTENYFATEQSKLHNKQLFLDKCSYPDMFKKLISDRELFKAYLEGKNYSYYDLMSHFNLNYWVVQSWVTKLNLQEFINYKFDGSSHYETCLINFLKTLGVSNIELHNRAILDGLEIDIYLPDYKLGIEFNGDYYHSSAFKDKYYHQHKSLLAINKGINLIHIWEHEWNDPGVCQNIKELVANIIIKHIGLETDDFSKFYGNLDAFDLTEPASIYEVSGYQVYDCGKLVYKIDKK